jgi:FlaA1/EpsC-like NDP-sugar epimerase
LITLDQAVRMVTSTFDTMQGGELMVPRIPSMKVTDLAQAIAPGSPMHDVGLRPGEKLHEEMISREEGRRAALLDGGKYYLIQPDLASWGYVPPVGATPVPDGFVYRSDLNDQWYTREEIAQVLAGDA